MDNAIQPNAAAGPGAADEVDWTGQVLGEFRLLHRLGRGGMGQVYLAEQTSLKRKVALKLLHPDLASNERSLLRFKAEAENVARATHANIVQIYTIGQANGVNYLALEYVEGKNLREFIEKKGTPELSLGLHIMMQVASALQRASELGIIHRDIKPENILLTKKGEVKVADFGLSRCFAEESAQSITQSQVTMGTPLYMSPEQVERKTVDTRTDIYSFGVTCYHMFAGTPPFKGNSPIEVAYQHVHKEPPALAEIRPDLPPALFAIIQKMMAKKPEERYQNAREITRDIKQLCESLNLGAVAAISMSSSFIGNVPPEGLRAVPTQPWLDAPMPKPKPWKAIIAVSAVLAMGGGLLFGWVQHVRQQPVTEVQGPVNPPNDPDRKPPVTKENEKMMLQMVERYLEPKDRLEMLAGLQHSMELTVYFLRERKLAEAEKLFADLINTDPEKKVHAYRMLSRIGHATMLAFKDDWKSSNTEFVAIFEAIEKFEARAGTGPFPKLGKKDLLSLKDDVEAYRILWKDKSAIALRKLVATALEHNYANAPKEFPAEKLDLYRVPPRPTVKAPPNS